MIKGLLKKYVLKITHVAVEYAEEKFGRGKGIEKKQYAIAYILAKIALPIPFKALLSGFLIDLITECIELAVVKLNK